MVMMKKKILVIKEDKLKRIKKYKNTKILQRKIHSKKLDYPNKQLLLQLQTPSLVDLSKNQNFNIKENTKSLNKNLK